MLLPPPNNSFGDASSTRVRDCSWRRATRAGVNGVGLIDEYDFVVHPRLAGHGPTRFAGLSK